MDTENTVKKVLEDHFGFHVEKIAESESKTPDFRVQDGNCVYLIEVKEKQSNPEVNAQREQAFSSDEIFKMSESLATKTVLQNVVRNGAQQINSFATDDSMLRVVWVHCTGLAYDATFDQLISGLYGNEMVVNINSEDARCMMCYYFGFSQFYKYRNTIDAVMVSGLDGNVALCINNHSPRYGEMANSGLAKSMPAGVRDPISEENQDSAYVVDGDVDRRNKDDVLNYLQSKYGIEKLVVMNMRHVQVHGVLPD